MERKVFSKNCYEYSKKSSKVYKIVRLKMKKNKNFEHHDLTAKMVLSSILVG